MRVSAKADYAVRAMVELAALGQLGGAAGEGGGRSRPRRRSRCGSSRTSSASCASTGWCRAERGSDGGYWLARPADDVTLAEIIRAVEGPLATVRGEAADEIEYRGDSKALREVWLALRANIRQVLETVTLADVVAVALPEPIRALAEHPEATQRRDGRFAARPETP